MRMIGGMMAAVLLARAALAGAALADPALPPAGGIYDSQLGGAYPPAPGTDIVSRDRSAPPAPGLYNICYVNGFQTQPDETAWWLATHPDLLLRDGDALVADPNWPGEVLFDTRQAAGLMAVVGPWLAGCAEAGFDAVELDNLDTYARAGGLLSVADNLAYATLLNAEAARLGLASGQKNAVELGAQGPAAGFGFAISESCQVWEECDALTALYGPHVLEIEYTDTPRAAFDAACALRGDTASVVLRDRLLLPEGVAGHVREICP